MNKFFRFYYQLTAYVPRKLPRSSREYARWKTIFKEAFFLPDDPKTWATVAGQITSTPPNSIRKSLGNIANTVKRLDINALAQEDRVIAFKAINKKLEEDAAAWIEEEKAKEAGVVQLKDSCAYQEGPVS